MKLRLTTQYSCFCYTFEELWKHLFATASVSHLLSSEATKRSRQAENQSEADKRPDKKMCLSTNGNVKTPPPKTPAGDCPVSQPPPVVEAPPKKTHQSTNPVTPTTSTSKPPEPHRPPTKPHFYSRFLKQVYVNVSDSRSLMLFDTRTPPTLDKGSLKKRGEEANRGDRPSLSSSSSLTRVDTGSSPCLQSSSHRPGHSSSAAKTVSKGNAVKESRKPDVNTAKAAPKTKAHRPLKPPPIPDDISDLFKPDPCVVIPPHKTAKPKTEAAPTTSSLEKSYSDKSTLAPSPPCLKQQTPPQVENLKVLSMSAARLSPQLSPSVLLHRVKLEDLQSLCSKDVVVAVSPGAAPRREQKDKKPQEKHKSSHHSSVRRPSSESHSSASQQRPAPVSPQPAGPETSANESSSKEVSEEDLTDMELDIGLSFAVDLDVTQSSTSSEEDEEMLFLEEMMQRVRIPSQKDQKEVVSKRRKPGRPKTVSCTRLHSPLCLHLNISV